MGKRDKKRHNTNKHHVPPTSTCTDKSRQFIKQVPKNQHQAYHLLFGNAPSFQRCVEILKWWWKPDER